MGHLPVSNEAVDNVSIMNINNQHSIKLLTIVFRQLRSNLKYINSNDYNEHIK